jgi:hypothetical protein
MKQETGYVFGVFMLALLGFAVIVIIVIGTYGR